MLEPLVVRLVPDVLELRDPGGEDVRVAMVRPYGHATPVTGTTGVRVVADVSRRRPAPPLGGGARPRGTSLFPKDGRPTYGEPDHSGDLGSGCVSELEETE
ncbi:hypothetical protein GCM10023339_24720 [Alloalcanivorax gelatiniphagus]